MQKRKIRRLSHSIFALVLFFSGSVAMADLIQDLDAPPSDSGANNKPLIDHNDAPKVIPGEPQESKKAGKNAQSGKSDKNSENKGAKKSEGKSKQQKLTVSNGTPPKDRDEKDEPIFFKGDGKSIYSKEGDSVYLEKNVLITRGSMRFRSDTAKVFLQKGAENKGTVKMAEFLGNVKISKSSSDPSQEMTAHGNKAYFYNETRRVDLVGNARLWRDGHLVKGKQISYFIDTGTITVDEAQGVVKPKGGDREDKEDKEDREDVEKE